MSYNENDDMITDAGQVFRQVGWQIHGGSTDRALVPLVSKSKMEEIVKATHGGFSPVYIEVGKD